MFSVARSAQWVSSLPNSALSSSGVIRPSARACPITANTSDGDARYIVYVQLYRPMTAQAYVTTVGQSGDELRPYPRPPAA